MTLRRARFFGGVLDGQTREVAPGRRYLHLASCEVDRYVTETYVRDGYSGSEPDIVLHYRLESSEDATDEVAKADRENREQTMDIIRETLS